MVTEIYAPIGWTIISRTDGALVSTNSGSNVNKIYQSEGSALSAINRSYLKDAHKRGFYEIVPVYL